MTIKKQYIEIVALLEANKNKKVSTVLADVLALCESKNGGDTFIKNDDGITIAIKCYYFKKWFWLDKTEFGVKKNTASGYNTMSKLGNSLWTKQQRVAKKAREHLLDQVVCCALDPSELNEQLMLIEDTRKLVDLEQLTGMEYSDDKPSN